MTREAETPLPGNIDLLLAKLIMAVGYAGAPEALNALKAEIRAALAAPPPDAPVSYFQCGAHGVAHEAPAPRAGSDAPPAREYVPVEWLEAMREGQAPTGWLWSSDGPMLARLLALAASPAPAPTQTKET